MRKPACLISIAYLAAAALASGCGTAEHTEQPRGSEAPASIPVAAVEKIPLSAERRSAMIGDSEIHIERTASAESGPLYFRPHEDEVTSGEAARSMLSDHGGILFELRSSGNRTIDFSIGGKKFNVDPNRIFSAVGIEKTVKSNSGPSAEAMTAVARFVQSLFRDHLTARDLIVAVHNNTDGAPLTIHTYEANAEVLAIHLNADRDEDEFFYVTQRRHFEYFKQRGFNVVLENPDTVVDDGSLSVHCSREGIAYINVEAERGHIKEQIEMMKVLNEMLASEVPKK